MAEPFFSSSIQQDAHETLVKMLQVLHNITIFSQVDDLNLSQPLSQPLSQLTTSAIKNNFYSSFKITYTCRACNKKTINIDSFLDTDINPVDDVEEEFVDSLKYIHYPNTVIIATVTPLIIPLKPFG